MCYVAAIKSLQRKLNISQRDLHIDMEVKKPNKLGKTGFGAPFSPCVHRSLTPLGSAGG